MKKSLVNICFDCEAQSVMSEVIISGGSGAETPTNTRIDGKRHVAQYCVLLALIDLTLSWMREVFYEFSFRRAEKKLSELKGPIT